MSEEEAEEWLRARGFVPVGHGEWYLGPGADPNKVTTMFRHGPGEEFWYISVASGRWIDGTTPPEAVAKAAKKAAEVVANAARDAAQRLKMAQATANTLDSLQQG